MKKLVVALALLAAVALVVLAILHHWTWLTGLFGMGGSAIIAKARAAGRAAEDRERDKLANMTDAQVREETRRLAPGVADALDRKRAANADSAATRYRGRGAALVRSVFKPTNPKRRNL